MISLKRVENKKYNVILQEYEFQLEINREELESGKAQNGQLEQDLSNIQSELETCLAEIGEMEVLI